MNYINDNMMIRNIFYKWVEKQPHIEHKNVLACCALFQSDNLLEAANRFKGYYVSRKVCSICGKYTAYNITFSSNLAKTQCLDHPYEVIQVFN